MTCRLLIEGVEVDDGLGESGSVELRQAIRNRREELRLTQEEAAAAAGISASAWRSIEARGHTSLRPSTARGVAEALRWTPDSVDRILAGGEPEEEPVRPGQDSRDAFSIDARVARLPDQERRRILAQVSAMLDVVEAEQQ